MCRCEHSLIFHCSSRTTANLEHRNLLQINDKKLNERLGEDRAKADAVATKHAAAIAEVRELTEENNRLQVASRISDVANFQRLRNLGGDLFNLMQKTYAFNVDIYRIVKSNESTPASHLERSLIQEPFILEDAIGRRHPVYLQWTSSWESFEFTLKGHFRNMQGYKKVQNGEYVFQDHATRRDIDRSKSWTTAFLPGQIVDMSLIFRDWDDQQGESNSCRGCKRPFSEGNDAAIQW